MGINNILNTIQINETIATSGQPAPNQFSDIAEAGYHNVINLAMPDSTDALPDEGSLVTDTGMHYFHIPVPFEAPTKAHLIKFLKLMSVLEGEKTWVHCALNMRVSAFMQHYQKSVLNRPEEACVPLLSSWEPEPVWREFLKIKLI